MEDSHTSNKEEPGPKRSNSLVFLDSILKEIK
jgi:hypothetical protein